MNPLDFKELFAYNNTVRQNYIDTFKKTLSWDQMTKIPFRRLCRLTLELCVLLGGHFAELI